MGVYTDYDEKRDELKSRLSECIDLSRELLDENTWGYTSFSENYALELYIAIKKVRDSV